MHVHILPRAMKHGGSKELSSQFDENLYQIDRTRQYLPNPNRVLVY